MDYSNNDNEMWDWQCEEYSIQDCSAVDMPNCLWNGESQTEEDRSYMFDETTPIKACGDLVYNSSSNEIMNKGMEQYRVTSSQVKRRRMLQFNVEDLDTPLSNKPLHERLEGRPADMHLSQTLRLSGSLVHWERENSIGEALSDMSEWVAGFAGCEGLDQSSEAWLDDCFNDGEMQFSLEEMNSSGVTDVQIDSELCNAPPEYEANVVPEHPNRTCRNVIFKGRKSYMQTPKKVASSVVYPFAFVKPCDVHGDVTLKDINQRIHTPPPSKSKENDEDPSASYPTSALTGKPVVGKTKISTEGGKGSITIMRTKG